MKTPQQRKQQSIEKLKALSIPYLDTLPYIESREEVVVRSADEIAKRAIACLIVIQVACDMHNDQYDADTEQFIVNLLRNLNVDEQLTPKEKAMLHREVSPQDVINMVWKYEAYWVLLWALGIVDELSYPDGIVDCDFAIGVVSSCQTFADFMAKVNLRDIEEILDQADLIYRYDWACVNARLKQQKAPENLNSSVVLERHGALNWLIQADSNWDHPDVST